MQFISYKMVKVTVETSLNLAWAGLATAMFMFWLRFHPRNRTHNGMQLTALAICVFTLLPVISISDDLMAAQFPTESDSTLRWELRAISSHAIHHATAMPTTSSAGIISMPVVKLLSAAPKLAFVNSPISIRLLDRAPPSL